MSKAAAREDKTSTQKELGERVRAIRHLQGLTLADVAAKAGLPVSTISKLENGKVVFTYDKLMRLKGALDVDLSQLFVGGPSTQAPAAPMTGRRSIQRAGEGVVIETRSGSNVHLAGDVLNKHFQPMTGEVLARSLEEFGPFNRHPGEEFIHVLSGELELHTELYAPARLKVGDSIFFDSDMGHAYVSVGEEPCKIVLVCWSPN